jgi:hypothetical protein
MSFLNEEYFDILWNGKEKLPIVVTFGAGVDSTAKLVNMWKLDIRPDVIVFADTGGERPDIYSHLERVNKWCKQVDFPSITIVRHSHKEHGEEGLLGELKRRKSLPSIAFGFKTCSLKYKTTSCQRHIVQKLGIKEYVKTIGYGTGEIDRAIKSCESIKNGKVNFYKGEKMKLWFPLIDWKLNREDCKKLSKTVGFCTAKSSCYFCPAMKSSEVALLSKINPDEFKESIELERDFLKREEERFNDEVCKAIDLFGLNWAFMKVDEKGFFEGTQIKFPVETKIKGLGRTWSWEKFMDSYSPELPFMEQFGADMGCGCTDF